MQENKKGKKKKKGKEFKDLHEQNLNWVSLSHYV